MKKRIFQILNYSRREVFWARLLFAIVVWISIPDEISEAVQSHPNGISQWVDLTWIADTGTLGLMRWIALLAMFVYVVGWLPAMTLGLGYLFFLSLAVHTLANSHGNIGHRDQIVTLVLLAQLVVVLVRWVYQKNITFWNDVVLGRWMMYFSILTIAGCYVTSAITKIDATDGLWAWKGPNIGIQLVKTERQNYYNHLNQDGGNYKGVMSDIPSAAEALMSYPMTARWIMLCGLLLELFAFLALLGRLPAMLMGLGLISMHLGIRHWMGLNFDLNVYILVIFFVNIPYWLGKIDNHKNGAEDHE